MKGKLIVKWIGLAFAVGGGFLLGIGVTSLEGVPSWWWLLSLLFICIGSFGVVLSDGKNPSQE